MMELLPIATGMLRPGDAPGPALRAAMHPATGDLLVVSSKVLATCEGATRILSEISPSPRALEEAKKTGCPPAFMQAVLEETDRLHGTVLGACPGALLTELRPDGLAEGTILTANAGMDASNTPAGTAIGWPRDPVAWANDLWLQLGLPVIISDSCCHPRRTGVTAVALTCAGLDPLKSDIGSKDLHGNTLHITVEAVADQLATAANMLMGNAAQGIPAVLVRGSNIPASSFVGWVKGIEPERDLFAAAIGA